MVRSIVFLSLLSCCDALQLTRPLQGLGSVGTRVSVIRSAGFGTVTRKPKKKGGKSRGSAAGLTTDAGWVPLVELEAPLKANEAKAVGRSISGKPYLVRRLSSGDVTATSCECGRCEYPLLKAECTTVDGAERLTCDMCGAAFSVDDGSAIESKATGNPVIGGLLRNKPQKPLLVFPTREVDDGRVFVNITPQ